MSGFIVMSREAIDHPLLRDGDQFRAWFWLVSKAVWKPTKFDVNGRIVTLERGQLCVSIRQLAEAWGWSKSSVDRFLTRLKTETMIGTDNGTGRLVITICNYAKYQDVSERSGTPTGTEVGTPSGQQRDIKEPLNQFPSSKDEGRDPKKVFWDNAKSYLGVAKASQIGKWAKLYGQPATAAAITEAQFHGAVDPIPYIESILRKQGRADPVIGI